jgi:hypothetical protein
MPVNWYASLILICVVGLILIGFSRYQRTHQTASSAGPPTTSQVWHAALATDICGTMQPPLPPSTNTKTTGLTAGQDGVVTIAPRNSSESGANATLGKFVSGYKGLELSSSSLKYPGKQTWTNGDVCPKGTPDHGKPGVVIVDSWNNFESKGKGSETSGEPGDLLWKNGQLVTMAFVPATSTVPKPPASSITALLSSLSQGASTTTTLPTSVPPVTPTTASPTATTAPPTATTVPSTTATTTAKNSGGTSK